MNMDVFIFPLVWGRGMFLFGLCKTFFVLSEGVAPK